VRKQQANACQQSRAGLEAEEKQLMHAYTTDDESRRAPDHRAVPGLAQAGLPPMHIHDLRHSTATILLAMGVNVKVVAEIPGQSDPMSCLACRMRR